MCPYLFISLFLLAGRAVIAQAQPQPGQIPSIFETLRAYTCNNVIPAPPTNLVAVPKDAAIDFGWWPPTNRPCNVTYEVRAAPRSVSGTVSIATETKNTFITLSGLKNDVVYDITVLARTVQGRSTAVVVAITPTPPAWAPQLTAALENNGWTCAPIAAPPTCPAATSGLCRPLSCQDIATRGACAADFVRSTNWESRVVNQYCSQQCGCSAVPALKTTIAGPAADACCAFATGEYWQDTEKKQQFTSGI